MKPAVVVGRVGLGWTAEALEGAIAVRVPLGGAARGPRGERGLRVVVGRPGDGARDRGRCVERGPRGVGGQGLRRLLLAGAPSVPRRPFPVSALPRLFGGHQPGHQPMVDRFRLTGSASDYRAEPAAGINPHPRGGGPAGMRGSHISSLRLGYPLTTMHSSPNWSWNVWPACLLAVLMP